MGLLGTRAAFLVQFTRGVFHKFFQVVEAGALCTAAVDFVSRKCPRFQEAFSHSRGCRAGCSAVGPTGRPGSLLPPSLACRNVTSYRVLPCFCTEKTFWALTHSLGINTTAVGSICHLPVAFKFLVFKGLALPEPVSVLPQEGSPARTTGASLHCTVFHDICKTRETIL